MIRFRSAAAVNVDKPAHNSPSAAHNSLAPAHNSSENQPKRGRGRPAVRTDARSVANRQRMARERAAAKGPK